MEIYKWVPLDRKRHLRTPLSTAAASGTTTPTHGRSATNLMSGTGTIDSSAVTSKAPSTGYGNDSEKSFTYRNTYNRKIKEEPHSRGR